jgi:hypothetical protein
MFGGVFLAGLAVWWTIGGGYRCCIGGEEERRRGNWLKLTFEERDQGLFEIRTKL